jgi:hypothetical protein
MASGLADDALEVLSSAGTCEYPGYVSYRVLKGVLREILGRCHLPHKWRMMGTQWKTYEKNSLCRDILVKA